MDSGVLDRVENKIDNITTVMGEVREQVKLTNGRVTKLEIWQGSHDVWTDAKKAQLAADESRIIATEQAIQRIELRFAEGRGAVRAWVAMSSVAGGLAAAIATAVLSHYIK
jgi:ribosomal protein L31